MRKLQIHKLFVYLLSVTLILTLGMNFRIFADPAHEPAPDKMQAQADTYVSSPVPTHKLAAPAINAVPTVKPNTTPTAKQASQTAKPTVAAAAKTATVKQAAAEYEVTAYYLNVRMNGYSTSQIRDIVKKGDILKVVRTTAGGWLQLEGGGYVHGGYAKLVSPSAAPASQPVTTAATSRSDALPIKPAVAAAKSAPKATNAVVKVQTLELEEPNQPKSAVKSDSGLSKEHIAAILKNTALAGQGLEEVILAVEEEYGINAYFTIAVMKLESGNGKSKLAKSKNNLFGLNAIDGKHHKAFSFKTKGDSVRKFGQLISKSYLGKGYTTIEKIAKKYCPANPKWPSLVSRIMKADYRKL
ncbi:flagellum-specific peptidoglycan hydrolase FlgJ [Paenibacillus phyllosphaerae]|uniref:Flagellum-specific peptidoglycan hydrolase FlgJ n=1 Tax=Paenibacillus phyllosphaerae TaxID=274593 RepID=A0A7W5B2Z8_9BACL|nr:glucosaminidase domain-containing protein [Paenibacillus phyllosphaerae]MBB3113495.1 flagellum-specific peptidoglycan hydrolase FlgJ [Paenibacillus phyllosphaerae]